MNFKGFMAVCAAATAVTSGARAADAIVFPDPEPAEYVRVCDVYGAGFYYIPGTETCLRIGGYVRFDVAVLSPPVGLVTLARFAPYFDAQTQTEWGTLRSYAQIEFDAVNGASGFNILDAYIEVIGQSGTFRAGHFENPYATFLEFGGLNVIDTGFYPYFPANGFSYTFTGASGFSAVVAALDGNEAGRTGVNGWATVLEAGLKFEQDWGTIGALASYDTLTNEWGATAAFIGNFGSVSAKLQAFYSSDIGLGPFVSSHSIVNPSGGLSRWSALASVAAEFTPTVGAAVTAQWFDITDDWLFQGELQFTPVPDFKIVPSIAYTTPGGGIWAGLVRFQRDF